MAIEPIVDAIRDIIKQNIIAKTNVTSDIHTGDTTIYVENSFQFRDWKNTREIVLIDYNYDVPNTPHYQIFEYSQIEKVNNTTSITLTSPVVGNWLVSNKTFIQKTVGHTPLYEENVYYGDREVIPLDQVAIAVEPSSLSNDWMFIQGGLNEEYKIDIIIYGRDIKFEDGKRVLDRYSDHVYQLMINNIHLNIDEYSTRLTQDYLISIYPGDITLYVADTPENRENIIVSNGINTYQYNNGDGLYTLQDNYNSICCWFNITNITYSGGQMILTMDRAINTSFKVSDFAYLFRTKKYYLWDSRVDNITYGKVSKGSAYVRASQLSWYGKRINQMAFPQASNKILSK